MDLPPKQLRMASNPKQIYYFPIYPYKKEIIPDMAFHTTFILPFQ